MKTTFKYLSILAIIILSHTVFPQKTRAQYTYVSFQVFYDQLSSYGRWVDDPDYGYIWFPDVGPEFEPYMTRGHWIYSRFGWTWMSEYPWGWATFHYGRWDYDNVYGWFWIPGTVWGPAWVVWVSSGGYYGWAPMGPGITISISFGANYYRRHRHWFFVRKRYIDRRDVIKYRVRRTDNDLFIRNSSIINNTYTDQRRRTRYVSGPNRTDVQRVTGRRINTMIIQNRNKPGHNIRGNRIQIYRPEIRKTDNNGRRPAPSKVIPRKEVQRPSQRTIKSRQKQQEKVQQPERRRSAEPQKKDGKSQPERRRDERVKQKDKKQDRQKSVKQRKKDDKSKSRRKPRTKPKKDKNKDRDHRNNS